MLPHPPWETRVLSNGLRVTYVPDPSRPLIAVVVYYGVGARNEVPGQTGFAHLFEHMMFQGSRHIRKNEFFRYIEAWGGRFNGNTTHERTVYFEEMPAAQLPLALWLEADRMGGLEVTADHLRNQIDTVKEERRIRYDNAAYMGAWLKFNEVAYTNFANAHAVIGSMDDLEAATVDMVKQFFLTWYHPANAWLIVAGAFVVEAAHAWVEKLFGDLAGRHVPPLPDLSEPPVNGPRQVTVTDPFAHLPAVMIGWRVPPRNSEAYYPLRLAHTILFEGQAAGARRRLVHAEGLAVDIYGIWDGRRGPGMMSGLVILNPTATVVSEPSATLYDHFTEIFTDLAAGLTDADIDRARGWLMRSLASRWQKPLEMAIDLGEAAILDGEPGHFIRDYERLLAVTTAEVKAALTTALDAGNTVFLAIQPGTSAQENT